VGGGTGQRLVSRFWQSLLAPVSESTHTHTHTHTHIQQNGVMSMRSFLPASQLSPLKYLARWSVFSPQDVHCTSIGKKMQPTSAPLSLGTTSLPPHSTVTWSRKRSRRRSATATSSLWRGGFAHAHHGVGTSFRTSKSSPGRSPA